MKPHYSSQECSVCGHTHPDNRHEERFICQRCNLKTHSDTNAGATVRNRVVRAVLDDKVVNKRKKSVAWRKRKNILGRESSGMPVESGKTQTDGSSELSRSAMLVEAGIPLGSDAPTTARSV